MGHMRVPTLLSFALVKCRVMVWIWCFGMRRSYKNAGYVAVELGYSPGKGTTALLGGSEVMYLPSPTFPLASRRGMVMKGGKEDGQAFII